MSTIEGIGIDIIEINRIEEAVQKWGERFLSRIFTQREIKYCYRRKRPYPSLAGRFAAKEATMKALGTGWRRGIRWIDIEILPGPTGAPTVSLYGEARKIAGSRRILVSLSHSQVYAVSTALLQENETGE